MNEATRRGAIDGLFLQLREIDDAVRKAYIGDNN